MHNRKLNTYWFCSLFPISINYAPNLKACEMAFLGLSINKTWCNILMDVRFSVHLHVGPTYICLIHVTFPKGRVTFLHPFQIVQGDFSYPHDNAIKSELWLCCCMTEDKLESGECCCLVHITNTGLYSASQKKGNPFYQWDIFIATQDWNKLYTSLSIAFSLLSFDTKHIMISQCMNEREQVKLMHVKNDLRRIMVLSWYDQVQTS